MLNKKRGVILVTLVMFVLVQNSFFVSGVFDPEKTWEDTALEFDYTYALGIEGIDDDKEPCDETQNKESGILNQGRMEADETKLGVAFPSDWHSVDSDNIQSAPSQCIWKNLPLDLNKGCYFLVSEDDDIDNHYGNDCVGWFIPPGEGSEISSEGITNGAMYHFFSEKGSEDGDKIFKQGFSWILGGGTEGAVDKYLGKKDSKGNFVYNEHHDDQYYFEHDADTTCVATQQLFRDPNRAFICLEEDQESRWYICDAQHISKDTGNYILAAQCYLDEDCQPAEDCEGENCGGISPDSECEEGICTIPDEGEPLDPLPQKAWFCEEHDGIYGWELDELTCDDEGIDCDNNKDICEQDGYSWIEDSQTGDGMCCGDDGLDDFTLEQSFNDNNYICLSSDKDLVGYDDESAKVFEDEVICGTEWCWVNAVDQNSKFNIFTIKKPGETAYDIVSDSRKWQTCDTLGPLTVNPLVEDKEIANHFYCYPEGEHYSWAECFGKDINKHYNKNVKGRHSGDGLYNLYLDEKEINDKGEAIVSGPEIIIESDEGKYPDFYGTTLGDVVYFDFSGYDQLEFFARFTNDASEVLTDQTLTLPADISLTLFGPEDENGEPIIYLKKNVLGNAVNNPLFGEDNWLHLKVPIPNDLRAVSHLKITPSPTKNWISVKNVYLSKQGQPSQICSGKDDIGGTSWLTSFDDGNVATNVNAEEMCISHYGTNAWLGDVTEVEETWASCCGNNDDEYYSGDSKPIGDPGIKYGCWNSQPIADGQTVMDVEFMVDYTEEEIEIGYPAEYLDLYLNVFGFGLKCPELKISNWDVGYSTCGDEYQKAYCLGQSGQETCLGLKEEYFENKYLSCETGVNYEYDEGVYEVCEECKTDEWDCKGCVPTIEATEEKSCYLEPKTLVQVGQEKVSTSVSFEENPKLIDTLIYSKNGDNPKTDEIEYGDFYQAIIMAKIEKFVLFPEIDHPQEVYFFHPTQGNLGTELSLKQLKEYGSVQVFAEANKIKTFPPILTPKSQIPFTYPCQSDECLYPLPGIPGEGITVTNSHPELYELYFVTFNDETQKTEYQLITPTNNKIEEPANLLAKKVAQQVVFLSPFTEEGYFNEDEEEPIEETSAAEEIESGFYGCQAAKFIEDQKDSKGKSVLTSNELYCSVKSDFFCSPSVITELPNGDKYTTINSWSDKEITKVGYEPVEIEFEEVNDYFTHLELNLKEEEFLPKDRNFSAKVLPARNFIPNAEFKTKDNKLPHWEIFDDSIVEQKEKGDVEKKLQQVTLKADKTLKTERIAVPKDSNLKFSHSGTAQAEITLVDKDGIPTPVTNPTKFPTNQASYLIIEFTTGTIKEPFLQLIDDLGGTDYYYNSQQYPDEFDARAGLACCPQDYCWNGYACVEPMNIFAEYTQISEHIEEGRDYRCIQGEWKHSPIRWDWQGLNWGFCEKNSQCFVTKEGSPEFETENFYENNPPICIDNEDYVLDHYCEKGDWSSRTKFLASTLLEAVEDDDYVIYCTNYKDAFINYGDEFKLGGGFPFVKDVLPGTPLDEAETEELYTCFEDLPAIVEMEENTCINNVCVIMFEDGAKRAFATTLNKDITDPNSFLQTLNIQTDENPCQGTGNYIECETEQGELWYSEKLNAVIYSKQSIQMTPSVIDKVVDWFKDLFGIDAELSDQNKFVQEAKNFRELYLLSKGDKKAKAIKEVFPYNKTLIAEYENFQTPICDYVTVYDLGTELLETLSGMKKLSCTQDNATNLQSVEIVADDEALDFFWPQLTGKLRVG